MFANQIEAIAAFAWVRPYHALAYLVLFNLFLYVFFTEIERYNARLAGFKGPTGLPIIGNIWQIRTNAAEQYRQWAKKFGAVYQIQLGNVPVIVVNSAAAARTIFGQNSQALSSRPEFYTFHKVRDPHHCSMHLLMSPGRFKHCWHHNRDVAIQRIAEKEKERSCLSLEQAVCSKLHTIPRCRD
jgi:Cytochrome P450